MATRSLTEVFILMRNNAMQNRQMYASDQVSKAALSPSALNDDRMALVQDISTDPEAAIGVTKNYNQPPDWIDGLEEIQYDITRITQKVKELSVLHDKHLNRPTLDDSVDEEHAIEIATQEITQMFHRCQRAVKQIGLKSRQSSLQEQKITKNVMASLAGSLQDLSLTFRKSQSSYLKKVKNREERSKQYFDHDLAASNSLLGTGDQYIDDEYYDRGFTDVQMKMVDDNSMLIDQRDKELQHVAQSISDLNEIFRDLASLVVEQGTILDRIDYNLEKTQHQVQEGMKQLQKAEGYQKSNRKMLIVLVLAVLVIVLIIILIAVKLR